MGYTFLGNHRGSETETEMIRQEARPSGCPTINLPISFMLALPALLLPFGSYDEGNPIVGAMRISTGEIPYIDFWMQYPPGVAYMTAGLMLFGLSPIVALRAVDLVARTLLVYLFIVFIRIPERKLLPFFSGLVGARLISTMSMCGYNALLGMVVSLLCIQLLIDESRERRRVRVLGAGLLFGLLAVVRHDFAVYLAVSLAVLDVLQILQKTPKHIRLDHEGGFFLLGAGLFLLPIILALCANAELRQEVYQQLIAFPLIVFPKYRSSPFSSLRIGDFATLVAVPILLMVVLILSFRKLSAREWATNAALALFGLGLLNQAGVRTDYFHIFPALCIYTLCLLRMLSQGIASLPAARMPFWRRVLLYGNFCLIGLYLYDFSGPALKVAFQCVSQGETLEACLLRGQDSRIEAAAYIAAVTSTKDRIFIVADHNDRVLFNDLGFYALARRLPASRYHELHPGLVTEPDVQTQIIQDLTRNNCTILVEESGSTREMTWNPQGIVLDGYISSNFSQEAVFGPYKVLRRK